MKTIMLSAAELDAYSFTLDGHTYYLESDVLQITPTGQRTTRYVDADDRPGRTDHDGDGWTEHVSEHTAAAVPADQREHVTREYRLHLLAREFAPGYLEAMNPDERRARLVAELDAHNSRQGTRRTRRAVKIGGQWTTEAIPADPDEDDRL